MDLKSRAIVQKVLSSDRVVYFDCDDTLIMWKEHLYQGGVTVINGKKFIVHKEHLQKIKDYHTMGFLVIVWSNSGHKWAEQVAAHLGISDIVFTTSKPHRLFDDKPLDDDNIRRAYIEPKKLGAL